MIDVSELLGVRLWSLARYRYRFDLDEAKKFLAVSLGPGNYFPASQHLVEFSGQLIPFGKAIGQIVAKTASQS